MAPVFRMSSFREPKPSDDRAKAMECAFLEFLEKAEQQGWTDWEMLDVIMQLAEKHLRADEVPHLTGGTGSIPPK